MTENQKEKAQTAAGKLAIDFQNEDIDTIVQLFTYIKAWVGSRTHDALNYNKKVQAEVLDQECKLKELIDRNQLAP